MDRVNRLITPRKGYICGLVSFALYFLSFLIGYQEESVNHLFLYLKLGLIFVSALLFLLSCSSKSSDRIKTQYALLCVCLLVYHILLVAAVGKTVLYIRDYAAILNGAMWISTCLFSVLRFRTQILELIRGVFTDRRCLILILSAATLALVVIILSAEPTGVTFTLDSNSMFDFIYRLGFESFYDGKLTTFHSHVSFVYAQIIVLFKMLFGNIYTAFFIMNSLCIIAASFGMTFLLSYIMPGRKVILYVLGNAMFMLSPWVCGMSTYYMYDYYIWCLFPLLILFALRRNWIGFFVTGVMITFSKSSGLAVFGSACIGVAVMDFVSSVRQLRSEDKKHAAAGAAFRLITDIKYWYFLLVAVVFLVFFKMGISEVMKYEDTRLGLDTAHLAALLKMFAASDFIWIFVIATLVLIYRVYISGHTVLSTQAKDGLSVVLIADLAFIVFNCACITFKIPRYMDSHIVTVYLCAAILFISMANIKVSCFLMAVITATTLVGAFRMVDPVSLALFNRLNIGDHDVVCFDTTVDHASYGDNMICNREYYSYEILLYDTLTYVLDDMGDNDDIMMSLGSNGSTWEYSGARYAYDLTDGKHYFTEFYDKDRHTIANTYDYEYFESENMIPFEMHYVFPEETVSDAVSTGNADVFYYIYMPTLNEGREKEITDKYKVLDEQHFEFRGWQMNCIKFAKAI